MPATRLKIFVSSVQKEFERVRSDLKAFLLGDAVLRRFVSEVFLFEELPARDRRADQVYLEEVKRCDIYLAIFGNEYGAEDREGVSPTEREYDHATKHRKTRLVYVWGSDEKQRTPKMRALVRKASGDVIRRRVEDTSAFTTEVYASLVDYLDRKGALRIPPFDTSACDRARLSDLSRKRIDWFLETARAARGFPLEPTSSTKSLLTHLKLMDHGEPTNAAVLLFGKDPQRFHRTAEIKCVHVHGTEYLRPFPALQIYGGDAFEQVDEARDFVLGKINRSVGTRSESSIAPRVYELPPDAISEAIVNAVAHRDYHSNASVEVRLFTDRLEVWNPGALPGTLTLEDLREDHASVPNNPLLAESLYLSGYIERVGSGTQKVIALCKQAGLPEPTFEQRSGFFVLTLWRDWLTREVMTRLELSDRQRQAVLLAKTGELLSNKLYQERFSVSKPTASRDLDDLARKGVLERFGTTGKGTYYVVSSKGLTKGSKGRPRRRHAKGS